MTSDVVVVVVGVGSWGSGGGNEVVEVGWGDVGGCGCGGMIGSVGEG